MEGATQELLQVLSSSPQSAAPASASSPPPPQLNNSIALLHYNLERLRESGDERYLFLRCLLELLSSFGSSTTSNNNNSNNINISAEEEERLLYHCIAGVRYTTLHYWEYRRQSYKCCLRDFLFAVGLGMLDGGSVVVVAAGQEGRSSSSSCRSLPKSVTMACLSCAASMWKRGWTTTIHDGSDRINGDAPYQSSLAGKEDDGKSYLE